MAKLLSFVLCLLASTYAAASAATGREEMADPVRIRRGNRLHDDVPCLSTALFLTCAMCS